MGGKDPYSASKASAEHIIEAYANSYFINNKKIKIATARAGNVIGGGDWSDNRIVPDAIRSWKSKKGSQCKKSSVNKTMATCSRPTVRLFIIVLQIEYYKISK